MSGAREFPLKLLQMSDKDRLDFFMKKTVLHQKFTEAYDEALSCIMNPTPALIVMICGPTGAGKTQLCKRLVKSLYTKMAKKMEEDPGYLPVVHMDAIAPDSGAFNMKEFYIRAMMAAREPMINQKRKSRKRRDSLDPLLDYGVRRNAAVRELRRAYENCLKNRCPSAVIVDEGQHLTIMPSGRRLRDNMEVIKCLTNNTGVHHVLIGTYDLLTLVDLSAQLARRNRVVHLARYRYDIEGDMEHFKDVVLAFQKIIPIYREPNLEDMTEYLYEKSLGCVGILKIHLHRAFTDALNCGAKTIDEKTLKRNEPRSESLLQIMREISEREKMFELNHDGEIRMMLGMGDRGQAAPHGEQTQRTRRRVGQRNPVRDAVGRDRNAI